MKYSVSEDMKVDFSFVLYLVKWNGRRDSNLIEIHYCGLADRFHGKDGQLLNIFLFFGQNFVPVYF